MKKPALGRGLDALLPEITTDDRVMDVSMTEIDPSKGQPRQTFDKESLEELAESIRSVGVLQPLLVIEKKGRYQIVAGERRFRAAKMAGLKQVPCIVRSFTLTEQMEVALIENLQREDLNPIEEAAAIRTLLTSAHHTQESVAQRLGKSRPAVANLLRLLSLPEDIQTMVREGRISSAHARVIAGIDRQETQFQLARLIVETGMSVREAEKWAAGQKKKPASKAPAPRPAEFRAFEESVFRALGARASLKGTLNAGKLVITYRNREELDAIYQGIERLLEK